MVEINESNMIFGEFEDDKIFKIEKSTLYHKIGTGIKVVEFILLKNRNELNFIEAKLSSPKPQKDNDERFNEYIVRISDKFIHSFNLYYSAIQKRNEGYEEINDNFSKLDNSKTKFKFILVIKDHKEEWLLPISEALKRNLAYHNKIWKSDVIAINEATAKKHGLVKAS